MLIQELQERLDRVHVDLDELQQGPDQDRHRILAQAMKAEVARIGESAAKADFPDVNEACTSAILLIESVQDPAVERGVGDYLALCKSLGRIRASLTRAAEAVSGDASSFNFAKNASATIEIDDLLTALHQLHGSQCGSTALSSRLLPIVIDRVETLKKTGGKECSGMFLKELLDESSRKEAEFIEIAQAQIPAIVEVVGALTRGERWSDQFADRLRASIGRLTRLLSSAKQANAPQSVFFDGLIGFLTLVVQQRVVVTAQRGKTVESRLQECLKAIHAWAEERLAERSAIGSLLGMK
ncbi:MAG: hypothetical protein NNA20_08400 [Nitrospira sp.]|nr:hypothetical protein [Nitrospira sp.]MCP9442602.1 hypothetical protein [Nitrospira sp.]